MIAYDRWVEELRNKIDIAAFDTHTRFKLLAAKGNPEKGLKLLDKLDSQTR